MVLPCCSFTIGGNTKEEPQRFQEVCDAIEIGKHRMLFHETHKLRLTGSLEGAMNCVLTPLRIRLTELGFC